MTEDITSNYVFLDDEADRKKFIARVHETRQQVIDLVHTIPEMEWYTPRYHGWSVGAMLGHLNLVDNLSLLHIRAALLGISPRIGIGTVNSSNDFFAKLFQKRLVRTSLKSIDKNESRIAKFLLNLPVSKFSIQIFDPPMNKFITLEQYIQERFLFHWQRHLNTMQRAEGLLPEEEGEDQA